MAAEIRVLDVKEGQAVLLSHGGEGVLIDTGHAGMSHSVLNKLNRYGVNRLSALILTHLHPDHASGYFRIREAFSASPVYSSCHPLAENVQPDMTRWVYEALKSDPLHNCLKAGARLKLAGMTIDVLWPVQFRNANLNLHSLVLLIEQGTSRTLIMGDAGYEAEATLISQNRLPDKITNLVVGHHGAADATGEAFIDAIRPEVAVISVNSGNIRGYPAQGVIDRLKDRSIRVIRTDEAGDIRLTN